MLRPLHPKPGDGGTETRSLKTEGPGQNGQGLCLQPHKRTLIVKEKPQEISIVRGGASIRGGPRRAGAPANWRSAASSSPAARRNQRCRESIGRSRREPAGRSWAVRRASAGQSQTGARSEEHKSEFQSPYVISYAV